jgi:hypothetical protein
MAIITGFRGPNKIDVTFKIITIRMPARVIKRFQENLFQNVTFTNAQLSTKHTINLSSLELPYQDRSITQLSNKN